MSSVGRELLVGMGRLRSHSVGLAVRRVAVGRLFHATPEVRA